LAKTATPKMTPIYNTKNKFKFVPQTKPFRSLSGENSKNSANNLKQEGANGISNKIIVPQYRNHL
jgi:hypothetical protein